MKLLINGKLMANTSFILDVVPGDYRLEIAAVNYGNSTKSYFERYSNIHIS